MELNEYQEKAKKTAKYQNKKEELILTTLGLAGETGEVVEKIKKLGRDKNYIIDDEYLISIKKELGDVLWYLSTLSNNLGITLEDVALTNLKKIQKRHENGTINGEGDDR
ncbi:nucleoside triphosphate pyrophosphohydrolase family protein [Borreliella spielmanii]|uniref:MazG nucleotide pyrophosphohydrolase domain protein n=2 Tax=Borreliella spielmanii TaxID=88916 RepID=B9X837_9SPIR|nr:nucleoside triphosphate pyrophosphohydrolase family protein [Borreliella spielmanii]EEF84464.1 MazG nucleotide pyrophosphohydrolase domain protein [Borreliella spielmanii A14S]MBB6031120.1 NTP pyrophosphatase (non-canonical NTP hydrolase) [Borreliella spielmanii]WKC83808.1 nucleoside triphosphate pyrophosphohydrolase family protein [Borreliella spielmanii]